MPETVQAPGIITNVLRRHSPALPAKLTVQLVTKMVTQAITTKCDLGHGRGSTSVMIVPSICVCSYNFFFWSLESLRL